MKIRKRVRSGKSQNMKLSEPLRVVAREVGKSVTIGFEIEFYETEFNITITNDEADKLITELKQAREVSELR